MKFKDETTELIVYSNLILVAEILLVFLLELIINGNVQALSTPRLGIAIVISEIAIFIATWKFHDPHKKKKNKKK